MPGTRLKLGEDFVSLQDTESKERGKGNKTNIIIYISLLLSKLTNKKKLLMLKFKKIKFKKVTKEKEIKT